MYCSVPSERISGDPPETDISIDPVASPKHRISTCSSNVETIGVGSVISNDCATGPHSLMSFRIRIYSPGFKLSKSSRLLKNIESSESNGEYDHA